MEKERREREEAVKMTTADHSIGSNCSAEEMGLAIVPFQALESAAPDTRCKKEVKLMFSLSFVLLTFVFVLNFSAFIIP
jgi:hypothetical protein